MAASLCWKAVEAEFPGLKVDGELVGGIKCQWITPATEVEGPEVVLYLFGGGFIVGCPQDDLQMTARLATQLRRRVCVPHYRLAPEHPFPAALEDARAVFCELSSKFRVMVVGESAGGNLALQLLQTCELGNVTAAALFSPWIDLTHSGDSHAVLDDPTLSKTAFLEPAAAAYAGKLALSDVSPLFGSFPARFPPVIISSGTRDLLLR